MIGQQLVINKLKNYYTLKNECSHPLLEAPGICNGLVHVYHRKCIQLTHKNQGKFTLEIAKRAAAKVSKICQNIVKNDTSSLEYNLFKLCFFQLPNQAQPKHSFCKQQSKDTHLDDIKKVNTQFSQFKSQRENTSLKKEKIKMFDSICESEDFAATLSYEQWKTLLTKRLPLHKDELIRVAHPYHVIAMSYHEVQNRKIVFIFDPNNPLSKNYTLIELFDLDDDIDDLIRTLGNIFYGIQGFENYYNSLINKNQCLSLKYFNINHQKNAKDAPHITGDIVLNSLFKDKFSPQLKDDKNFDTLFICSEYGHSQEIKTILHQYPNIDCNRLNGTKVQSTPLKTSIRHGYPDITQQFESITLGKK